MVTHLVSAWLYFAHHNREELLQKPKRLRELDCLVLFTELE